MPIIQTRLISLVHIIDQVLSVLETQKNTIRIELDAAQEEFFQNSGPQQPLACNLIARLQGIEALVSQPILSETALTTLISEREHFNANRAHNIRAARSMRKYRAKKKETI